MLQMYSYLHSMVKLQDPETATRNRPEKREKHKQYLFNVRE